MKSKDQFIRISVYLLFMSLIWTCIGCALTNICNKMPYRAFSRQANRLTLNIPVLQGLLKVNSKAE